MLEIKNLSVAVNDSIIISSFSVILPLGSVSVLRGANGSGKSTIINALIGHPEYEISQGEILFNGTSITHLAMHERARLGILVIMQQQVVIPGLLIVDYFFQLYTTLYSGEQITILQMKEKILWAFDFVGLDPALLDKSVCQGFSGGQKKRFELVHVLILNPRYVVLDEVDSGLDAQGIEKIPAIIAHIQIKNPQIGWLFVTHNKALIERLQPDQIVTLERTVS